MEVAQRAKQEEGKEAKEESRESRRYACWMVWVFVFDEVRVEKASDAGAVETGRESESWLAMREGEVSNGVVQESDRDVKKKSDARVLEPEEFTGG